MTAAAASTLRRVVAKRDETGDGRVIRPRAFAGPATPTDEELTPYDITAAGLDDAMVQAQLQRLNPGDRSRARRHLGLVPTGPDIPSDDPYATEKAVAKLRHPSVARVWKLRAAKKQATDPPAG
jgi:hypothetical protein